MALETFKIVNKIALVCLQNLVSVKHYKYSFRHVNVLDVPRVKPTHSNLLPQHYGIAFRTISGLKIVFSHFKSLIRSWNDSKCCCSACR